MTAADRATLRTWLTANWTDTPVALFEARRAVESAAVYVLVTISVVQRFWSSVNAYRAPGLPAADETGLLLCQVIVKDATGATAVSSDTGYAHAANLQTALEGQELISGRLFIDTAAIRGPSDGDGYTQYNVDAEYRLYDR